MGLVPAPSPTTLDLVTQLCRSREGEALGLPDGCMPGSMCAVAHLYPGVFFLILISGVLIGICGTLGWQTHVSNRALARHKKESLNND